MNNHSDEYETKVNHPGSFLAGVLFGGLVGAGAMLLMAPQSGKETRTQIQQKSIELRDQASGNLDVAVAQVRGKARQINADVHDKAEELQLRGQEIALKQMDRASAALDSGKKAVQGL